MQGDLHDIGKNLVASMLEGGGFEVIDVTYEKMPAFMKERTQDYMGTAKLMGLVK